ncbi:putative membrane protein [Caballeronia cordobensis]|nr:putative membrane protein [Burkholderia sp. RPE67]
MRDRPGGFVFWRSPLRGGGFARRLGEPNRRAGGYLRMRRKLHRPNAHFDARGPISAYAEETRCAHSRTGPETAYLRTRGGNQSSQSANYGQAGLSPPTRRKRTLTHDRADGHRPISAYAEETRSECRRSRSAWAYLRVRGGNSQAAQGSATQAGPSPRTRRKRVQAIRIAFDDGPISAHAEETRDTNSAGGGWWVYLRARGGNLVHLFRKRAKRGLSPRTRRKLLHGVGGDLIVRSISAYSEETDEPANCLETIGVYLRVLGGNSERQRSAVAGSGLSPRTRRKHGRDSQRRRHHRAISAHAEETRS